MVTCLESKLRIKQRPQRIKLFASDLSELLSSYKLIKKALIPDPALKRDLA
jgi:hypothetical protein